VGVFFASWSWVGFEAAPNSADEAKNPVRVIPIRQLSLRGNRLPLGLWSVFGGVEDDFFEFEAVVYLADMAVDRHDELLVVFGGDDGLASGLEAAPGPGHGYPASTPTTKSMSGSRI
jgi:hypothetical protein